MNEEKIIPYEKLPITHPFMFNKVLTSDLDTCKGVIETLLGIKISRVECVQDVANACVSCSQGIGFAFASSFATSHGSHFRSLRHRKARKLVGVVQSFRQAQVAGLRPACEFCTKAQNS